MTGSASNPESRGSGFIAARCPGTTTTYHADWRVCQKFTTRCAVEGIRRAKFTRALDVRWRRHPVSAQPEQDQGAHGSPFETDHLANDQNRIVALARNQAIEGSNFHPRHRGKRCNRFLVFEGLGKAE